MAFLDNLKTIGKVITKTANDAANNAKTYLDINTSEGNLKKLYEELGRLYYHIYDNNPDPKFEALFEDIAREEENIATLKEKIENKKVNNDLDQETYDEDYYDDYDDFEEDEYIDSTEDAEPEQFFESLDDTDDEK